MIPRPVRRLALSGVVLANNKAKRLAIRLTRWTGKSGEYVHPKHLLGDTEAQYWYLAHLRPGAEVLDVGCGNGMHAIRASRRVARVAGVDGSFESLAVARRTVQAQRVANATFFAANLEDGLPVRSGRFDAVICLDLLEHIVRRDFLLGEIRRALRREGVLLLAVPNRGTSWKLRLARAGLFAYSDPDHKTEYTLAELESELGRNGFRIAALQPTVYDTPLIGAVDLVGGLSLPLYRRLTELRRRLARRYPEENAGFYAVCVLA
ncbi:MAG TPA: class I SAM-dependent methyltransferase [Pseudomonadales bacterium]|nr:class I SAM-dependent methyltransferase [Pseudomonadales bacterium]